MFHEKIQPQERTEYDHVKPTETTVQNEQRAHIVGDPAFTWKNLDAIVSGVRPVDFGRLLSFDGVDSTERGRALERLARDQKANGYLLKSFIAPAPEEKLRILEAGLLSYPDNPDLLRMKNKFFLQ